MKQIIVRWSLLILVGLPIQGLMYALYPIAYILWRFFIYEKPPSPKLAPPHEFTVGEQKYRNEGLFLDNHDDHGAFTGYGFYSRLTLALLIDSKGNFIRRFHEDWSYNMKNVSGDVVVAWTFAQTFHPNNSNFGIKVAVNNYVKYLGSRSDTGWVSAKCNNMGVNYCPDGWMGIGQPTAGPQFYTTSSLLALGYNLGTKYKVLFWTHWIFFGGWYWAFFPIIYTKASPLHYARDITMKALYVHLQTFGPRWWITMPMRFINGLCTHRNDLFEAMFGNPPLEFPQYTSPFFSQRANAAATLDGSSNSIYLKGAMEQIARETRIKG